jgi:nicotinamidase/pyrazinamidase
VNGAIVVDIQGDFTQLMSGSLAVPRTSLDFLNKINKAIEQLKGLGIPVWASQDWHPLEHISFIINHPGKTVFDTIILSGKEQTLWPPHCVQGTSGAELLIDPQMFQGVIQKGMNPQYDSYSCFQDDGGQETELDGILKSHRITKLLIFGIATDYCVRWTALDGLKRRYDILVIKSLCRGVDPETSAEALKEIESQGGIIMEHLENWTAGKT